MPVCLALACLPACAVLRCSVPFPFAPAAAAAPPQVREVLEGYLDDDQDMKDMNITAKEQHALQVSGVCVERGRVDCGMALGGVGWGGAKSGRSLVPCV